MRKASPDDIPRLVALMTEFYSEAGYPLNQRRAAEAFGALIAGDHLGQPWLIEAESQDVGYIVVTLGFSMEYGGRAPLARAGGGSSWNETSSANLKAQGLTAPRTRCCVEAG